MSGPGQAGQQIQANGQVYFGQDFYIYTATFGNIAPGGNSQQNIQIQSDSDFEWIEATAFGFLAGSTPPYLDNILLPINISLVDSGSSRQLFNAPIPLSNFAGNGRQPFILPVSRLFKAFTNIQVVAVSLDPVNTYNFLSLNFIGRKLFVKNSR